MTTIYSVYCYEYDGPTDVRHIATFSSEKEAEKARDAWDKYALNYTTNFGRAFIQITHVHEVFDPLLESGLDWAEKVMDISKEEWATNPCYAQAARKSMICRE